MLKQLKSNTLSRVEMTDLMGKWYELARSANHFEAGMSDVRVFFEVENEKMADIIFVGVTENKTAVKKYGIRFSSDMIHFKIRPLSLRRYKLKIINFYKESKIIMVSDKRNRRLWIFSQIMPPDQDAVNQMIAKAKETGFDTNNLIVTSLDLP